MFGDFEKDYSEENQRPTSVTRCQIKDSTILAPMILEKACEGTDE